MAAGDMELVRAVDRARSTGDHVALANAALALAEGQAWGAHPGRAPALLREAYGRVVDPALRSRLATALVRCWAYGMETERVGEFADLAVQHAEECGDEVLLADALDATLLVRWGPDDLGARSDLTERLVGLVAHLDTVEARMTAHIWRLTVALENLDAVTAARQVRILDALAVESGSAKVRCFADSRSAMFALVQDRPDIARNLWASACSAGAEAELPDLVAIEHTSRSAVAIYVGDKDAMTAEAVSYVDYGRSNGLVGIAAFGAELWARAGELDRSAEVLATLAGGGLSSLPRGAEWLPTVASLVEVAARTGASALVEEGIDALEPYAGRGIVDAGAVLFRGTVTAVLHRACAAAGREAEAQKWKSLALAEYARIGSRWGRLDLGETPPSSAGGQDRRAHFRTVGDRLWIVGFDGSSAPIADAKGLRYLHELIANPGREVTALELVGVVEGNQATRNVDSDAGAILDSQAKAAYRSRLVALDADLAEAREWADVARVDRLEFERDALIGELMAATGLGGRNRVAGSTSERARVAVRKAISAALDRITHQDPAFARYLRATVRTGRTCCYEPDPGRPVSWQMQG
ncbi:MAG: hypothetical protein LLG14_19260 [Nocardiaceae bacterium]|nr:hypothetical protein [Nocardiaceae bacterium]